MPQNPVITLSKAGTTALYLQEEELAELFDTIAEAYAGAMNRQLAAEINRWNPVVAAAINYARTRSMDGRES